MGNNTRYDQNVKSDFPLRRRSRKFNCISSQHQSASLLNIGNWAMMGRMFKETILFGFKNIKHKKLYGVI